MRSCCCCDSWRAEDSKFLCVVNVSCERERIAYTRKSIDIKCLSIQYKIHICWIAKKERNTDNELKRKKWYRYSNRAIAAKQIQPRKPFQKLILFALVRWCGYVFVYVLLFFFGSSFPHLYSFYRNVDFYLGLLFRCPFLTLWAFAFVQVCVCECVSFSLLFRYLSFFLSPILRF